MRLTPILLISALFFSFQAQAAETGPAPYAGSKSCRECHERFYQLWSTSMHGLAMQPYTRDLAKEKLTPQKEDMVIGKERYRAEIGEGGGYVLETGPDGKKKKYKIEHVLGGKNVYYFLTPLDKGRLQTLPVAYDVRKKEWFDTAASGMRHFPGQQAGREPVDWKEWPYTFNTACYSCHVSQLSTNYDPEDRQLQHHLGGAGHQLRDLPRSVGRAQHDHAQGYPKGASRCPRTSGSSAPRHHHGAAQRRLRLLPRQGDAR